MVNFKKILSIKAAGGFFRLDALALSVIATATLLGGCLSQPVLYPND